MSATAVRASPPTPKELRERQSRKNFYDLSRVKVPTPIYRHATPSAPWPWMNFDIDPGKVRPIPTESSGNSEWDDYPQNLFGNWTRDQVNRSQMLTKCSDRQSSTVYKVGMFNDGNFDKQVEARIVRGDDVVERKAFWNHLGTPAPSNVRVQALFVEDMTIPILQMLGTRYNVEPFFFASSANWIPSRYQEDPKALADHITVILPFVRVIKNRQPINKSKPLRIPTSASIKPPTQFVGVPLPCTEEQLIDTQAPLCLTEDNFLFQDLLSLHMVRNTGTSTIISYHPNFGLQSTSAKRLQSLVQRTGDSIYWSKFFKRSKDPTFLFLAILWYALYAWDEAFDALFHRINALEYDVLQFNNIKLARELHKLQAHLLYYQQLLRDFLRSVEFVRDTPNPAMDAPSIARAEREDSAKLLRTEANTLIAEINRLTRQREMMSERINNVTHLAFATEGIEQSKAMQGLTEVVMKDSVAMKQMAYLSMIYLPATYLANVFSMNVREINLSATTTLAHYIVTAVSLTLLTSWLVVACQKDSIFFPRGGSVFHRAFWPPLYVYGVMSIEVKRWLNPAGRHSPSGVSP